ncbi:MAG: hypothetical protein MUO63_21915 [Desulfobulbaceae bacterium]|nr:hypothetical protein [Desulfobulbaceae bacterium]
MRNVKFRFDSFGSMGKIVLLIILCVFCGCDNSPSFSGNTQYGVASPTLSPDNGSIMFTLCDIPGKCDIASYKIVTKTLTRINPTGQDCGAPVFSPDGQMLTFTSGKEDDQNVFVMNGDGSSLRQLTYTVNDKTLRRNGEPVVRINGGPSFSPDRTKIIFARSGIRRHRSMGGEMISHWDFYEIDIVTGRERQLTNFRYYRKTRPYYLPDGQGFIFSGSGPKGADLPAEMNPKNGNEIMVMDEKFPYPHRAFEHETYAVKPTISTDGAIAFVSRINEFDGLQGPFFYDLFLRKEEKTMRLTTERFAIIAEPFLSFDGSLVVFLASKSHDEGPALWLVKSDGTGLINIGRPWNQEK